MNTVVFVSIVESTVTTNFIRYAVHEIKSSLERVKEDLEPKFIGEPAKPN